MNTLIRTLLELMVMFSLIAGIVKLHEDWHAIEPPHWRAVIVGFLSVVGANAIVLLYNLTIHLDISWRTCTLLMSYVILMGTLFTTRLYHLYISRSVFK